MIVVVLLAVTQAPVPGCGQAADNPTSAGDSGQHHGKQKRSTAPVSISVANQVGPSEDKTNNSEKSGNNNDEAVAITKLPTVSVSKDWADKSYWLFSGLLVVVSGFQAWLLWRTLRAIKSQADTMESQVSIQRETLRPRLTISNFVNDTYEESALGKRVSIDIKIANSGGIPAYGVIAETWIEFLGRGPMERPWQFSSKAKYHKGAPINIDTAYPQGFQVPFNRCLTEAEIFQMREAKGAVCFRIRLTYLAFDKECHFDHAFAMAPKAAESIAEYTSAN